MSEIRRIYVEKKKEFAIAAEQLLCDLKENLGIAGLSAVRVLNRYDIAGIGEEEFQKARCAVFAEPPIDHVFDEQIEIGKDERIFAVEYLPGQYDQRADSAAQCIQVITLQDKPLLAAAKVFILSGSISAEEFQGIKDYLINPVDSREAALPKPGKLTGEFKVPADVATATGFTCMSGAELDKLRESLGLAMSREDFLFCREYFKEEEKRDPTITEIKVLDTYWSDHCRHTTFETQLQEIEIEKSPFTIPIEKAYRKFLQSYDCVYGNNDDMKNRHRDISLMKIAAMSMREQRKRGTIPDVEFSAEINACSIIREVEIEGKNEKWLVLFKNETHNHPTEIEPFGGAATCLGGAIRDPLSGRAYVYQAMRVTGSGDPRRKIADTLPGKLPQRKIVTEAAHGYSSYGNQIGVATGQVAEIYHEGYVAKRLEVGAVIGAAPQEIVARKEPEPGDIILLIGGRTGRDGIGGATGSSKEHTEESTTTAGAEVQKGNPPEERKLQRLFRNPEAVRLIKRCNDFGAGGVSVAIGELADGLVINLDRVPKKYEGLDGTELAISESQERMAVLAAAKDIEKLKKLADAENLEATEIASVTAEKRMKMYWRKKKIVDISRRFIDTHGVRQTRNVYVAAPGSPAISPGEHKKESFFCTRRKDIGKRMAASPAAEGTAGAASPGNKIDLKTAWLENLRDLNVGSQKGLVERFDSTVGAGTVLMPFGGKYQHTPIEAMAARIPTLPGSADTTTGTLMSFGFNPELASWSPFHGGVFSVIEAAAKIVATGGNYRTIRASLQEYFEKLGRDKTKWGKPFSALLGAYYALTELGIPAIGGKDSMSGSFKDLHVPPTLITFAVDTVDIEKVISPEFKQPGSPVIYVRLERDETEMPDFARLKKNYALITDRIRAGVILSAASVKAGGLAETISKMCFGNRIGFKFAQTIEQTGLFSPDYGSLILEVKQKSGAPDTPPDETAESTADELPAKPGAPAQSLNARNLARMFDGLDFTLLGYTKKEPTIYTGDTLIPLEEALSYWQEPLETIFPTRQQPGSGDALPSPLCTNRNPKRPAVKIARPRVFIPVFPGANCEYETAKAFEQAGAAAETVVFRNLTTQHIYESLAVFREKIANAQIIAIPGGFSAGDEPDGSGKFIAAVFRNPGIAEEVTKLLNDRDGLMLGICNGFQALVKLGLVPYGRIMDMTAASPDLTFNRIGRHISCMVRTRVTSTLSPWFMLAKPGEIHTIPVSHGEGRFIAPTPLIDELFQNGQVATQYVDFAGQPNEDIAFNPNGSMYAIEGITSPDGRVFGKMGHSERNGPQISKNVPGRKDQRLFASGVRYFA